jgi:hypothetical protein
MILRLRPEAVTRLSRYGGVWLSFTTTRLGLLSFLVNPRLSRSFFPGLDF